MKFKINDSVAVLDDDLSYEKTKHMIMKIYKKNM